MERFRNSLFFVCNSLAAQWEIHQDFGGIIYFGLLRDVCVKETDQGAVTAVTFIDINSKVIRSDFTSASHILTERENDGDLHFWASRRGMPPLVRALPRAEGCQ